MASSDPSIAARTEAGQAPVMPDVLQEHLEELAFLYIQRRKLLFAPDVPFIGYPPHEERIAAHWDGLVTGVPHSVALAADRLEEFDPWEGVAAARVWLELGSPAADDVASGIAAGDPGLHGTWREALRLLPGPRLLELFPPDAPPPPDPAVLACLVYAWGWHGALREQAAAAAALGSDPTARYAAARAIGWCAASLPSATSLLSSLLRDPEPPVRRAAFWSVVLLQPSAALERCRSRVRAGDPDTFELRVLGLLGGPADIEPVQSLLAGPPTDRADALRALGSLGSPAALDVLVGLLAHPGEPQADAVKEALAIAMGLTPATAGDSEEEAEPPSPEEVLGWWQDAAPSWQAEPRWLRGQPFPWRGPPAEQPMESLWRSLLMAPQPELEWLRRAVPDGFFNDALRDDAVPGE
jgi:hypothetical protein